MSTRKILIIDDDDNIRDICRMSLEDDFAIEVGSSGSECLKLADSLRPDLIILDVRMPDMTGPQTLERLRQNPATSSIPVIFLTASIQAHETSDYLKLDIAGLLYKPFDPMKLTAEIQRIMPAWQ